MESHVFFIGYGIFIFLPVSSFLVPSSYWQHSWANFIFCKSCSHVTTPLWLDIWNLSWLKHETFYELKNLEILQAEDYIYNITFHISILSLYFKHLLGSNKKITLEPIFMCFPKWWLYQIRKCISHISLVLKRHIPLCTIKECNLPKATAFLMMLFYKLPTAGSSCSFNHPKTMVWEPVPGTWRKIQINLTIFCRGVNVMEKFCGTMVENSFKGCTGSGKHGGMELSEYDYTTHITCLIGLSFLLWLAVEKQVAKSLTTTIYHGQLRYSLFL